MKLVTVVGARPQFVKAAAAAVSRELRARHQEILFERHPDMRLKLDEFRCICRELVTSTGMFLRTHYTPLFRLRRVLHPIRL